MQCVTPCSQVSRGACPYVAPSASGLAGSPKAPREARLVVPRRSGLTQCRSPSRQCQPSQRPAATGSRCRNEHSPFALRRLASCGLPYSSLATQSVRRTSRFSCFRQSLTIILLPSTFYLVQAPHTEVALLCRHLGVTLHLELLFQMPVYNHDRAG